MSEPEISLKAAQPYSAFDPRRAAVRLALSAAVGISAMLVSPSILDWRVRAALGWDLGAFAMIALAWAVIARADQEETATRAGSYDPGRAMVWVIALGSSLASFFAALFLLRKGQEPYATLRIGLALAAVLLSWVLTHTMYTLRYAHLYYRHAHAGGIEFPGGKHPRDSDFAYFAFTLGMCFQTSDVTITSHRIRRAVLVHALISFAYNTTILALALNIAFGMLG